MRFKRETDLQSMCLYVIVDNISIFSRYKKSTEIYINFLRRRYSHRLFELIERKCLVPEEYLVWLLSPYWTNVSLPGSGYAFPAIVFKFQSMGDAITSLNLDHSACTPVTLSAIVCCVKNVTTLNLSGTCVTDAILLLIRKMCPSLISLNLSNCRNVTDTGLKNLCSPKYKPAGFPSLKALNITRTNISTKSVVRILKHLTSLQILTYHNLSVFLYKLHKADVYYTGESKVKYNLKNLDYQPFLVNYEDSLVPFLMVYTVICPNVTHVFIQDKISEKALQLIAKFQNLQKLKLVNIVHLSRESCSISPFLTIKGEMLTQLELFQMTISAEVITNSCINLKYLFLCGVVYEDFKPPTKTPKLHHLEALTMKHIILGEECPLKSIELLMSSSINLNELNIQYAEQFTEAVADAILKVPRLTTVDFSFTDIKPSTLLRFFNREGLKRICTDGCPCISINDEESGISKVINDSPYGNTCSWEIDFSELEREPSWNCSLWTMENPFKNVYQTMNYPQTP